uniref:Uncharacterized protein n=1 Tax=Calcidiscus leptoporus TaxID=127549 RepID=A0A7S0NV08_9EUKA
MVTRVEVLEACSIHTDGDMRPPLARLAASRRAFVACRAEERVLVSAILTDEKVELLFAWLSMAFAGDRRYNDLMLAFAAIFGDYDEGSAMRSLVEEARAKMPPENQPVGERFSLREREAASLGAMGAAQWTGRFKTRPHALLDVRAFESVDAWVCKLPRGSRRTIAKLPSQNWSVNALPIRPNQPAPHSSLAHFRCVVAHEVRLLADSPEAFFDALSQAIGRYVNTVSQAGEIREYRDADDRVIAFAHEVRKGRTIRGQWFYSTDAGSKAYTWFHSVHDLVRRAIAADVDIVDLGPSGTDAFSQLKERYGFASVDNWHMVADYQGPFWYEGGREDDALLDRIFRIKRPPG